MKNKVILALTIVLAAVQAKADIAPTVMLSHSGVRTMYNYDQVQQAVDDAVDGDTIYLSNGTFSEFNVSKRIMVRGTGPETIIQGSCTVYIAGTSALTMPVLDALTFTGNVNVTSAYKQFTIRKCQMNNLNFTESDFYDVKLDRCYIQGTLHLTQNVKDFNCFNTKIYMLHPYSYTTGSAYFQNCNIRGIDNYITATFDNCVLRYCKVNTSGSYYGVCLTNCRLNYCIYPTISNCTYLDNGKTTTSSGAFFYNPTVSFNNCYQVSIVAENVVGYGSNSYLGNDGTMVGCYGGQHPYRRTPELPRVTKHSVAVDAANKKLNVTLTLTKE